MTENLTDLCKQCVHNSPLFEGLSEDELNYLESYASFETFKKNEIVFREGDGISFISFLKSGLLKFYKTGSDNRDQIISLARPNDCVGLLGVFSNNQYPYSICAIEDSVIYYLELSRVKYIIRNNGAFGIKLLGRISQAADVIINNVYSLSKRNLRGRIAFILLEFSNDIYNSSRFDLPVSRREIGELISMTTENVIRILSEFRRDGIISIEGKIIILHDKQLLENISKFG